MDAILKERLFGYGTPYRVTVAGDGAVQAVETDAAQEAETLSQMLMALAGAVENKIQEPLGNWVYSMPFGRCGVDALPREHIQVHFCSEAWIDVLSHDGLHTRALCEGESVCIEPGTVVRLRARSYGEKRVLVAFQTQDHTPLLGNAGPFKIDGIIPEGWCERLAACHADFAIVARMAAASRGEALNYFFARMSAALEGKRELGELQCAARAVGSYGASDEGAFFARQRQLLSAEVIERVRDQDEAVFRFPGMFGAVAPLFNLIA
jgi:hypothetical protein